MYCGNYLNWHVGIAGIYWVITLQRKGSPSKTLLKEDPLTTASYWPKIGHLTWIPRDGNCRIKLWWHFDLIGCGAGGYQKNMTASEFGGMGSSFGPEATPSCITINHHHHSPSAVMALCLALDIIRYAPTEFTSQLPTDVVLDGELWYKPSPSLPSSPPSLPHLRWDWWICLARADRGGYRLCCNVVLNPTSTPDDWLHHIKFMVFDAPQKRDLPYEERVEYLQQTLPSPTNSITITITITIAYQQYHHHHHHQPSSPSLLTLMVSEMWKWCKSKNANHGSIWCRYLKKPSSKVAKAWC